MSGLLCHCVYESSPDKARITNKVFSSKMMCYLTNSSPTVKAKRGVEAFAAKAFPTNSSLIQAPKIVPLLSLRRQELYARPSELKVASKLNFNYSQGGDCHTETFGSFL